MPVETAIISICIGIARLTAVSASGKYCPTKIPSTILYSACTSIDTIIGTDTVGTSLRISIVPSIRLRSVFCCSCFSDILLSFPYSYYFRMKRRKQMAQVNPEIVSVPYEAERKMPLSQKSIVAKFALSVKGKSVFSTAFAKKKIPFAPIVISCYNRR